MQSSLVPHLGGQETDRLFVWEEKKKIQKIFQSKYRNCQIEAEWGTLQRRITPVSTEHNILGFGIPILDRVVWNFNLFYITIVCSNKLKK